MNILTCKNLKKSEFVISDLLDKSEIKNEDMISILEHIHRNYIPHTAEEHPSVIRKKYLEGCSHK